MKAFDPRCRKVRPRVAVDLFPFLGIIVCVIGIVVLLVSGLIAGASMQASASASARQLRESISLLQRWIAATRVVMSVEATVERVPGESEAELRLREERLLAELAQAQKDLTHLPLQIDEARKNEQDGLTTIPIPANFAPGSIRPTFVECHAAGLTVYRTAVDPVTEDRVPFAEIGKSVLFARVASQIAGAAKRNERVVVNLLVRPQGVKAYDRAMAVLGQAEAPSSSIPISANGKLRFRRSPRISF